MNTAVLVHFELLLRNTWGWVVYTENRFLWLRVLQRRCQSRAPATTLLPGRTFVLHQNLMEKVKGKQAYGKRDETGGRTSLYNNPLLVELSIPLRIQSHKGKNSVPQEQHQAIHERSASLTHPLPIRLHLPTSPHWGLNFNETWWGPTNHTWTIVMANFISLLDAL